MVLVKVNKLNRILELSGVEITERQTPPAKGSPEPEDKKPAFEDKRIGTDQPKKEKMHRNMAETFIGDLLAQKYFESLEIGKGHEKVISLAAHILTIGEAEIRVLLSKFKVSEKDIKQIIDWVKKTK